MPTNSNVLQNVNTNKKFLSYRASSFNNYKDDQINIPFSKIINNDVNLYNSSLTSNTMIDCNEVNIINLSLNRSDTDYEYGFPIGVYYNESNDVDTAELVYQTEAEGGSLFFNQFPKRNRYIQFRALTASMTANVKIEGQVELSKYTQFTTNSQIRDTIDINAQANLSRIVNDYTLDLISEKLKGQFLNNRNGFMSKYPTSAGETIIGSGEINEPTLWSSLLTEQVNVKSDFAGDNAGLSIAGIDNNGNSVQEFVTLNGTSNVLTSKSFMSVDYAGILSNNTIVGNVSVNTATTGQLLNTIGQNRRQFSNVLINIPAGNLGLAKTLRINSLIDLRGATIKLNHIFGIKEVIQEWYVKDHTFNVEYNGINKEVFRGVVYVSIEHPGYDVVYDSYINCSLDLLERVLNPIYNA
tara:strand:+ start:318 stop:1550 length:1233 start_codon:yes stop_codon:yes gene_type:complete